VDFKLKIERAIETMPSLPVTVAKIMEIANNRNSTPNDLNKVITLDPVLTGKVLKLVNSAYYGVANQVTTIVRAIIMLGLNTIKNLAVSTAILGTMNKKQNFAALNMDAYWQHCLAVGVTAKAIATKMNIDPKIRDEYFISGLLHDIGKIVMNHEFKDDYQNIVRTGDIKGTSLWKMERKSINIDHTYAGELIAKKWVLSENITAAITKHHSPLDEFRGNKKIVFAVAVADKFCVDNEFGFSGNRLSDEIPVTVWQTLNLKEDDLYDIEDTIKEELAKAAIFLQITAGK